MGTTFPIKHDDNTTDVRYTVTREYAGHATKVYVARFCGDSIPSFNTTKQGAIKACTQYKKTRDHDLFNTEV